MQNSDLKAFQQEMTKVYHVEIKKLIAKNTQFSRMIAIPTKDQFVDYNEYKHVFELYRRCHSDVKNTVVTTTSPTKIVQVPKFVSLDKIIKKQYPMHTVPHEEDEFVVNLYFYMLNYIATNYQDLKMEYHGLIQQFKKYYVENIEVSDAVRLHLLKIKYDSDLELITFNLNGIDLGVTFFDFLKVCHVIDNIGYFTNDFTFIVLKHDPLKAAKDFVNWTNWTQYTARLAKKKAEEKEMDDFVKLLEEVSITTTTNKTRPETEKVITEMFPIDKEMIDTLKRKNAPTDDGPDQAELEHILEDEDLDSM